MKVLFINYRPTIYCTKKENMKMVEVLLYLFKVCTPLKKEMALVLIER